MELFDTAIQCLQKKVKPVTLWPGTSEFRSNSPFGLVSLLLPRYSVPTATIAIPYDHSCPDENVLLCGIEGEGLQLRYVGTAQGLEEVSVLLDPEPRNGTEVRWHHILRRQNLYRDAGLLTDADRQRWDELLQKVVAYYGV